MVLELFGPEGRAAREDWSLDPGVRHLNHGGFGAVPAAVGTYQQALRVTAERDPLTWFRRLPARVARAREEVADWLGAPREATALVANASAGATAVLSSLPLRAGDRVLVTDHVYGAVGMAVRRHAARAGAEVDSVAVPLDADGPATAALVRTALDAGPTPALLVVDHITSATARLMPVAEIAADCRERGVRLLIDGAHAPGQLARPLEGLHGAYWVGNLHKWPCAPRGTAVLVADPVDEAERQLLHPPIDGWGAPDPYPVRFDVQGTGDFSNWLAAPTALRLIEERYGWDRARAHMAGLSGWAQSFVAERWGVELKGLPAEPAPGMRLVPLPAGIAADPRAAAALQEELSEKYGCATAVTSWNGRGFVRLSAHVYNTEADYRDLVERVGRRPLLGDGD